MPPSNTLGNQERTRDECFDQPYAFVTFDADIAVDGYPLAVPADKVIFGTDALCE